MSAWDVYSEYSRIEKYEGRATGTVVNKHFSHASDGNALYYLDYQFSISGSKTIKSTGSVLKRHWDVLKKDDMLEIRYDRSDPSHNLPMADSSPSLIYVFFVFLLGGVFLIFGVMRLIYSFKK